MLLRVRVTTLSLEHIPLIIQIARFDIGLNMIYGEGQKPGE
ncbi:hypothetical protein LINPERPRIM_LOCUS17773 [Linum perenne]